MPPRDVLDSLWAEVRTDRSPLQTAIQAPAIPYRNAPRHRPPPRQMRPAEQRAMDPNAGVRRQALGQLQRREGADLATMPRTPRGNQFAEAGSMALEAAGLPQVRRGAETLGDVAQAPYQPNAPMRVLSGAGELGLGVLGAATFGEVGAMRPRAAPAPRRPAPPTRPPQGASVQSEIRSDGAIELARLSTPFGQRGQGQARQAMNDLIRNADGEGRDIWLRAEPLDKTTDAGRLRGFYRGLGFEDAGADGRMVRRANAPDVGNSGFGSTPFYRGSVDPIDVTKTPNRAVFFSPSREYASEFPRALPADQRRLGEYRLREDQIADFRNPETQRRVLEALADDPDAADHLRRRIGQMGDKATGHIDWVVSADPGIRDAIERAGYSGVWLDEGGAQASVAMFRNNDIRPNAPARGNAGGEALPWLGNDRLIRNPTEADLTRLAELGDEMKYVMDTDGNVYAFSASDAHHNNAMRALRDNGVTVRPLGPGAEITDPDAAGFIWRNKDGSFVHENANMVESGPYSSWAQRMRPNGQAMQAPTLGPTGPDRNLGRGMFGPQQRPGIRDIQPQGIFSNPAQLEQLDALYERAKAGRATNEEIADALNALGGNTEPYLPTRGRARLVESLRIQRDALKSILARSSALRGQHATGN